MKHRWCCDSKGILPLHQKQRFERSEKLLRHVSIDNTNIGSTFTEIASQIRHLAHLFLKFAREKYPEKIQRSKMQAQKWAVIKNVVKKGDQKKGWRVCSVIFFIET